MADQVQPLIAVTGGAFVALTCQAWARKVQIQEDGSGSAAGLIVLWPNGTSAEYPPSQQPIVLQNPPGGSSGGLLGQPQGGSSPSALATVYCQVKSMGAATVVRVTETN